MGGNPHLGLLSEDELFYGASDDNRLPIVARLSVSTGQTDVLLSGMGVPTFGIDVVAADDANIYLSVGAPQTSELQRLPRTAGAVPVALDSTASQSRRAFIGDVAMVGSEIFYSVAGPVDGSGVPPGLYAVDKMGGVPRLVVEAFSGRGLRVLGDALFFSYSDEPDVFPEVTSATLVRIPTSGGAPEIVGVAGDAPYQFEIDASGIYWVERSRLMAMPWSGGTPREIFSPPSLGPYPQVQTFLGNQFSVHGGFAYVSISNVANSASLVKTEVLRIPLESGSPKTLYQSVDFNSLNKIGILGDAVFFALNAPKPAIMRVAGCGCGTGLITVGR